MAGETVITIIGNLTREPELRSTSNGENVANFTIASSDRRFNRQTNQWEDGDTLFMNCSVWGGMAQHVAQSLHKGMGVIAQGRLKQRSYPANDGTQRTVVELRVDEIGPSLRNATAQVQRIQRGGAQAAPQGGFNPSPNNVPSNGFQQPQQPTQQPQQGADSWGANNNQPSTFGNFGNDTDF